MFLLFLATTDIFHDYVGTTVKAREIVGNTDYLPDWTACKGEWLIVNIDYTIRIVFMILVSVVLLKMINKYDEIN
jgi:hypothetical protein